MKTSGEIEESAGWKPAATSRLPHSIRRPLCVICTGVRRRPVSLNFLTDADASVKRRSTRGSGKKAAELLDGRHCLIQ